jgi:hypothetical protein
LEVSQRHITLPFHPTHFSTIFLFTTDSIKVGLRAASIAERTYSRNSIQVANILVRVGQGFFLKGNYFSTISFGYLSHSSHFFLISLFSMTTDGETSYDGKRYLRESISIMEKLLGTSHKQVADTKKLLEELEQPELVIQKQTEEQEKQGKRPSFIFLSFPFFSLESSFFIH